MSVRFACLLENSGVRHFLIRSTEFKTLTIRKTDVIIPKAIFPFLLNIEYAYEIKKGKNHAMCNKYLVLSPIEVFIRRNRAIHVAPMKISFNSIVIHLFSFVLLKKR